MLCEMCEDADGIYLCNRCHKTRYCGKDCQKKDYKYHQRICFPIDSSLFKDKNNRMLHDAFQLNLFQEYKALESRMKNPSTVGSFDQGRYYLYQGIVGMILFDPIKADMKEEMTDAEKAQWEKFNADIRKGGQLICSESPDSMHDPLILCFIPRQLHRDIDMEWHGIGNWRSILRRPIINDDIS